MSRECVPERSLENEVSKWQKIEKENNTKNKEQSSSSKPLSQLTYQHQQVQRKKYVSSVNRAISAVADHHFSPQSNEVALTNSGKRETIDLTKGKFAT